MGVNFVMILSGILGLGLLGILTATVLLMLIATKPRRYSREYSAKYVREQGLYGEFDTLNKEEFQIPSYDKYLLHGFYLPAEGKSNRYVIITHGIMDTCYGSIRYANLYHRLGFHVVIYDMRNHGENQKTFTTMGIRECQDLRAVVSYVRKRFGEDIVLGIHGESLGSATSILCLDDGLKLAFCVADCGYSDLIELMTYLVKEVYHVPTFFVPLGNRLVKLVYHYSFSDIRPIDNLRNNHTPILFIHGGADTYIPTRMSEEMYEVNAGYKELYICPKAKHACSILTNPEKYYEVLEGFIGRVLG